MYHKICTFIFWTIKTLYLFIKKPHQQIDIFKISKVKEFAEHHKQLYLKNEEVDEM